MRRTRTLRHGLDDVEKRDVHEVGVRGKVILHDGSHLGVPIFALPPLGLERRLTTCHARATTCRHAPGRLELKEHYIVIP